MSDRLDEPDRQLHGPYGVLLEAVRQGEMQDDFRVGRPVHLGEQLRVDRQHQVTPQPLESGDVPVVCEQPAAVAERVAVRLLHG
jgi:hypothetical protein